ncbi:MAG: hypothetical protein O9252_02440 [Algoriphagus sp.]|nr:hypothetical protein [Algoriphagus sp.]
MKKIFLSLCIVCSLSSCACDPEDVIQFAFSGMESVIGEGFLPSTEIQSLGDFQGISVQLGQNSQNGALESVIFLRLENGDPVKLSGQREVLARKCAELYLRDFEKASDYQKITIQFVQTDPNDPQNMALEEYTFEVNDF